MRITIESDDRPSVTVAETKPQTAPASFENAGPPPASVLRILEGQTSSPSAPEFAGDAADGGPPSSELVSAIQSASAGRTSMSARTGMDAGPSVVH